MKNFAFILMFFWVAFGFAQKERTLVYNEETNLIEVTYYHQNGKISQTGFYTKDGKLHGNWNKFSEEGKKIVAAKYNNGQKVGTWYYWINDTVKEVDYTNNSVADSSLRP